MKFQVLASGSKGNLTYIETNECKMLIDAGISIKEISNRSNIDLNDIDAIFITHEHIDHVKYIENIAKITNAVIYVNELSFKKIYSKYIKNIANIKIKYIEPNKHFKIKDVKVLPLNLQHDSEACYGYIFVSNNKSLGYCTDTGFIPLPYIDVLKNVNSLIIEANHDVEMLMNSQRPWYLKTRILSIKGHMSNQICGEVLNKIIENNDKLSTVVLAHLSEECNTLEAAVDTVLESIDSNNLPQIYVAKQWESLPLLEV